MEKVIFEKRSGIGFILYPGESESLYINAVNTVINKHVLYPGYTTNLFGMFNGVVEYKGLFRDESNLCLMVFFNGRDENGYGYYQCLYRINEYRIANKYKEGSCRDFILVNNKWK